MRDHGNWLVFEGLFLLVPIGGIGLAGAVGDMISPTFGFTPASSAAVSIAGLFTCLAILTLPTLVFAFLIGGSSGLRRFSSLAWILVFIGAFIAVAAAASSYVIPPSPEYSDLYWFRSALRLYSLGCVLLIPLAHLCYLARYTIQESTKTVEPTG